MFGNEKHILSLDKTLFIMQLSGFPLCSRSTWPDKQLSLYFCTAKLVNRRVCDNALSIVLAVLCQTNILIFLYAVNF
jgi:hypothetical protein